MIIFPLFGDFAEVPEAQSVYNSGLTDDSDRRISVSRSKAVFTA